MSYAIQETWRDRRGKKIYGSFHDGSRRIGDIDGEALYDTIEEAREYLENLSQELEVDSEIESEIVNVNTRTRYSANRKGDK